MSTLTSQDVADLAKVRRAVVSMWRKRPTVRGVSMPFPEPVAVTDGVARFAHDDVVEWLERTGRGNNRDHRDDAPALAVPDGAALEDLVTLLCWHVLTGDELAGTSHETRTRRAVEFDPDDTLLLREIRSLQPTERELEYIDDLVEASFGAPDALARLEGGRLKREQAAREIQPEAIELVRCVIGACIGHLDREGANLHADGTAISLDVADACGLDLVVGDRRLRRRAVIRGIPIRETPARTSISLSSLLGLELADAIDRADEAVLGLGPGDIAVLIGPAAALCDALAGTLQQTRAGSLRVGTLVAAVRLPRGLWREAHRQSLGVWVCLGGAELQRPWVADLGAVDHVEAGDLAADVAGALAQTDDRAFRYARRTELADVLATGTVVPRGVRAPTLRRADPTPHLDRVHAATLVTTSALDPLDVLVQPSLGRFRMQYRSLGELQQRNQLLLKRGSRIDATDASPDGTVSVLPLEVAGPIALDPFDAARKYPRAARTEPGDVIFVQNPCPRAWVDTVGGAMVASPARILRLQQSAEIGPQVLAAVINDVAVRGTDWQQWSVPVMPPEEADRLEAALVAADRYEAEARRRAAAAHDLKTALIDGVAAGALTLDAEPTTSGVTAGR